MRPVRTQTGVSRLTVANETKPDRSEFSVRPVSFYKSNHNVKSIRSSWETSDIISFKFKSFWNYEKCNITYCYFRIPTNARLCC